MTKKKRPQESDELRYGRGPWRQRKKYAYKWILDDEGNPLPLGDTRADLTRWGQWMEAVDRHIAEDYVGDIHISTVFLGLDHNFTGTGPPVLWETMIFGGEHDQYQARYRSKRAALAGHARALALVHQHGAKVFNLFRTEIEFAEFAGDEATTEDDDE